MLTLDLLKTIRLNRTLLRSQIAAVTGIEEPRLRALELREAEPWFDEAVVIARATGCAAVLPLIASGGLTLSDPLFTAAVDDLDHWRSSSRAPLSLACRVARVFGLADPIALHVDPLHMQIWEIIEAGERHPTASGWCSWCAADIEGGQTHLATCLPHNLWRPGEQAAHLPVLRPEQSEPMRRGVPAYGLRALREGAELTQKQLAIAIGVSANYYARLERTEVPLPSEHADALAAHYSIDKAVLYARP